MKGRGEEEREERKKGKDGRKGIQQGAAGVRSGVPHQQAGEQALRLLRLKGRLCHEPARRYACGTRGQLCAGALRDACAWVDESIRASDATSLSLPHVCTPGHACVHANAMHAAAQLFVAHASVHARMRAYAR